MSVVNQDISTACLGTFLIPEKVLAFIDTEISIGNFLRGNFETRPHLHLTPRPATHIIAFLRHSNWLDPLIIKVSGLLEVTFLHFLSLFEEIDIRCFA
jgi:hypothetical protein